MLQASSLCNSSNEARSLKHVFGTFLGTPSGAGTFRSTSSALLSGRGFRTSVAGRQDCNVRPFAVETVGFFYMELVLVTGFLGQNCPWAEEPKSAVYTRKTKKKTFRSPVLRSNIPFAVCVSTAEKIVLGETHKIS